MFTKTRILGLIVLLISVAAIQSQASAASPSKPTYSIEVTDMHCSACAQKIANRLYKIAGVSKVHANLKSNTAYLTPAKGKTISPLKIWEAIETAEFTPVKLVSPTKTYKKKPKSNPSS